MKESRSKKSIRNVVTGLANKMLLMVLAFSTRTIFIRLLGAEYTGISSLYSNILSVLSLAELGLGNVLMFYLYSALKNNDHDEISGLVYEFKRIYQLIIVAVLGVGLALVPFLHLIVRSDLNSNLLITYYILYLVNSVASYFVVYRTMVISADQNSYITNICTTVSTIVMYCFQIAYLLLWKNFLGFLIIQVICTVGNNLVLNHIACKKYPYLKQKPMRKTKVVNPKELFDNIGATFLFKLSDTILDQTDSILISILFGTLMVGYYSNYYLIIVYFVNIAGIIVNGLVASFGNMNAEHNNEKSFEMFRVSMLAFSIYGALSISCYLCVIQEFIPIWVGNQYLMDYSVPVAILIVFYLRMATNTVWMYRSSMGLFREVKYINMIAAGLNILLSIMLGKIMGISGVIVATAISRLATSFWFEGCVVFRKLKKPVSRYFMWQIRDFCVSFVAVLSAFLLCNIVPIHGILAVIIKGIICIVVTSILEIGINWNTNEMKILRKKLLDVVKR